MPKKIPVPSRPKTEVWWRNPRLYYWQLRNIGVSNTVWDGGYLQRHKIASPVSWMRMNFGVGTLWKTAIITREACVIYNSESLDPQTYWPVWSAKINTWKELEELASDPGKRLWVNKSGRMFNTNRNMRDAYTLENVQHAIVIQDLPNFRSAGGLAFYEDLLEWHQDHPDTRLWLHGSYSWRYMFGNNFQIVDWEPRDNAARGECVLPIGTQVEPEKLRNHWYWAALLGFSVTDLYDPGKRCEYNIKSAIWAGTYYTTVERMVLDHKNQGVLTQDQLKAGAWKSPQFKKQITKNSPIFTKRLIAKPGDRIVCDDCSLWLACKLYREGAVCALPGSKYTQMSDLFNTRDSGQIIKGLTKLLEIQVARAEVAADNETASLEDGKGLSPELSKLMNSIWDAGVDLVKLVDPSYRTGAKNTVNVVTNGPGGQRVEISQSDAQRALVQQAYAALEADGVARADITEEMIINWVKERSPGLVEQQAIEASVSGN